MDVQQLQAMDQSILISMITKLSSENNSLKESITDMIIKSHRIQPKESMVLFSIYIQQWLNNGQARWQLTTYEGYKNNVCKHIVPYFEQKGILLSEISASDIQQYYRDKLDEGLTSNSLLKHHNNIRKCLDCARKAGLIQINPADLAEKPVAHKYNATFYSPEEIEHLLSIAHTSDAYLPILLTAFLGFRRSEVLGLKWDAINFDNETIAVKRKIVRITESGKGVLKVENDLKNKSSYRTLCLPKQVVMYLKFSKLLQEQNYRTSPALYDRSYLGFICVKKNGKIIKPTDLSKAFARIVKKNNLRYLRFHDLRHSCASILYAMGYDLKDIQEWLGHSSISTTANLYIHLSFKEKLKLAKNLNVAIHVKEIESQLSFNEPKS